MTRVPAAAPAAEVLATTGRRDFRGRCCSCSCASCLRIIAAARVTAASRAARPARSPRSLDRFDVETLDDRRCWSLLAGLTCFVALPELGALLVATTPLRTPTADELLIYEALGKQKSGGPGGIIQKITDATESRGDFTGAAPLRETTRMLQHELG